MIGGVEVAAGSEKGAEVGCIFEGLDKKVGRGENCEGWGVRDSCK